MSPAMFAEEAKVTSLDDVKKREVEYRAFLRNLIRDRTARFVKSSDAGKNSKPLRRGAVKHDLNYFWEDELWCGDVTIMAWEEFSGEELPENSTITGTDKLYDCLNSIFDEEFRGLAKELKLDVKVLDG